MAAQFLTISKLSNIINMINLGQQSGILRVIRGQGPGRELGQIQFVRGEPVAALLGQITGANALAVLQNWGECVYSFEEQDPGDSGMPYDSPARVSSDPSYPMPGAGGMSSGSWPSYGYGNSMPLSPNGGGMPPLPGYTGIPTSGQSYGRPTDGYSYDPFATAGTRPLEPGQSPSQISSDVSFIVPRRTMLAERMEQLPLDRRERNVLLLVDGRRTVSDLARLTRRGDREVLAVLQHLERLGLIEAGR